jgi:hypothetical protein
MKITLTDWKHLKNANTDYFTHMFVALKFVGILLLAAITGLIHAFLPFMFGFEPYHLTKKVVDGTEKAFNDGEPIAKDN